jgi:hypothetical protein
MSPQGIPLIRRINKIGLSKYFSPEHMFFSHPAIEQESSTLAQSKKYIPISN